MTTISIPNTGYTTGTCGWLAKGLQDGTIEIKPGTSKSGKGGLWLWYGAKGHCLAIFNEYDLSDDVYPNAEQFAVIAEGFCGEIPLTPAAEQYLRAAAQEWCDVANESRDSDAVNSDMPRLVIER